MTELPESAAHSPGILAEASRISKFLCLQEKDQGILLLAADSLMRMKSCSDLQRDVQDLTLRCEAFKNVADSLHDDLIRERTRRLEMRTSILSSLRQVKENLLALAGDASEVRECILKAFESMPAE